MGVRQWTRDSLWTLFAGDVCTNQFWPLRDCLEVFSGAFEGSGATVEELIVGLSAHT